MSLNLPKLLQCLDRQIELDGDEYVQQYIVRLSGPPETYKGRQTQQKLEQILRKTGISFAGRSFLDLGCNKGFFPLYVAATGAIRAVGIDPDETRVRRATEIAELSHNLASFACDRFHLQMVGRYGVFDIVYVGSAYHYFWLDHRKHRDERDHVAIFDTLAALTGDVLIFEGCTSLDDEQWKIAAMKATGLAEAEIRAEFNHDAIMTAAERHFEITKLGDAGHAVHRHLYVMRKKLDEGSHPESFGDMNVLRIIDKAEKDRANSTESVSIIEKAGKKYIKKVLSKKREWCVPAITTFERVCMRQMVYPRGLCRHHSSSMDQHSITLYQEFLPAAFVALDLIRERPLVLRQRIAHFIISMQRDLLTAGLLHMDIHETNIFVSNEAVRVVDFEGLIQVQSDLYCKKFAQFYTLNFISLIEILFSTKVRRADFQGLAGVGLYGERITDQGIANVLQAVKCPHPEIRALYDAVMRTPQLLTNIELYDSLLRSLPEAISLTIKPAMAEHLEPLTVNA